MTDGRPGSPPRILIFDSGVGGLSVAQCIREHLPGVGQVYLADNACFPYGEQPESVVVQRCLDLIRATLERWPCDLIVVACNTASTVVLPQLRAMTSVPVVGVVPAIKPAATISRNRSVGLLATPATIRRPYLDQLIRDFASDCRVERIGHPQLVRWIEDWVAGEPLSEAALEELLEPFRRAAVDTVILGCTHYPLIREALQRSLPGVSAWVDSGEAIARRTNHLLTSGGLEPVRLPELVMPVDAALFTGQVPCGLEAFMRGLGLATAALIGHWPVPDISGVRAVGSV